MGKNVFIEICAPSVLHINFFFIFVIFNCLYLCESMHTSVQVSSDARRECQMPWSWSSRPLWVTWWVLKTELRSLNCWTISPSRILNPFSDVWSWQLTSREVTLVSTLLAVYYYPFLITHHCLCIGSSHGLVDWLDVGGHIADEFIL